MKQYIPEKMAAQSNSNVLLLRVLRQVSDINEGVSVEHRILDVSPYFAFGHIFTEYATYLRIVYQLRHRLAVLYPTLCQVICLTS